MSTQKYFKSNVLWKRVFSLKALMKEFKLMDEKYVNVIQTNGNNMSERHNDSGDNEHCWLV